MAKIFISYTARDRTWAFWIGVTLRDNGHEPFVHEWEIGAGENISRWMEERIKAADRLLSVFTDAYAVALYSSAERWAAYWDDPDGRKGFLVPVEVENVSDWPLLMKPLKRLSLVGLNEPEAETALLNFLEQPKPPDKRPAFPGGTSPGGPRAGGGTRLEGTGGFHADSFVYRSEPLPAIRPSLPVSPNSASASTHVGEIRTEIAHTDGVPDPSDYSALSQGVGRTRSLQQPISAPVLASSDDRYRAEGRIGTADAKVSLPASTLALINEFLTTLTSPLTQRHLVSTDIPAIGCPQDGQVGPQEAPMLPNSIRVIVPEGMEPLLAYYSAQEAFGSGVLAPRDWDCFGVYGSAGSTLYVVPRSPILDRFEKLKYGPVVVRTSLVGGTSGRFGVARISARVFPRARAFVERVRAEGVDDPADYVFSPWATDQLHRLSDFAVSYVTPAGAEGLGTALGLAPGRDLISGLVFLEEVPDGPFLDGLAVRLDQSDRSLYAAIGVAEIASRLIRPRASA